MTQCPSFSGEPDTSMNSNSRPRQELYPEQTSGSDGLYTDPVFRKAAGLSLRPGGLELTRSAIVACREHALLLPGAVVLDVGCGAGGTIGLLVEHGLQALGVDRDATLLVEAGLRGSSPGGNTLLRADAQTLPFTASSLDAVFCECVLSLLPDPLLALEEFARVLRPGACLVLADIILDSVAPGALSSQSASVNVETSGQGAARRSCPQGAVSFQEILQRLQHTGFRVLQSSEHSKALKELAVSLVWHGAKPGSLSTWLGLPCSGGLSKASCSPGSSNLPGPSEPAGAARAPGKRFSYAQWIAVKEDA